MIRRRVLAAAAVVPVALLAAACGGGPTNLVEPRAAKVGDEVLSQDDLVAQVEFIQTQPDGPEFIAGPAPGSWSAASLSQVVDQWVQEELLIDLGRSEGLEPDQAALDAAREAVVGAVDVSDVPEEIIDRAVLAEAMRQALVEQAAAGEGVGTYDEADVVELFESIEPQLEGQICVNQIVVLFDPAAATDPTFVPTEEQIAAGRERAQGLLDRIEAGEAFEDVARIESDDPETAAAGGDGGCFDPAQVTDPELAARVSALDAGEVDPEPFEFQAGLLIFTNRGEPSLEDVRGEIEAELEQQAAQEADLLVEASIDAHAEEVGVWVDPRYGTWEPELGGVVPPQGPAQPSTTTTLGFGGELGIDPSQIPVEIEEP